MLKTKYKIFLILPLLLLCVHFTQGSNTFSRLVNRVLGEEGIEEVVESVEVDVEENIQEDVSDEVVEELEVVDSLEEEPLEEEEEKEDILPVDILGESLLSSSQGIGIMSIPQIMVAGFISGGDVEELITAFTGLRLTKDGVDISFDFECDDGECRSTSLDLEEGAEYNFLTENNPSGYDVSIGCEGGDGGELALPFIVPVGNESDIYCELYVEPPPMLRVYGEKFFSESLFTEFITTYGLRLTKNGTDIPLEFECDDWECYSTALYLEEGAEYDYFFTDEPPSGYNFEIGCWDDDDALSLPFTVPVGNESDIYCGFGVENVSYGLEVYSTLLDENDEVLEGNTVEFTAKLTNQYDGRVLSKTMTSYNNEDDWGDRAFFEGLIRWFPENSDEYIFSVAPKNGYEFLGCEKISRESTMLFSPILYKEQLFSAQEYSIQKVLWGIEGHGYTTCYHRILSSSFLEIEKTNNSSKEGVYPGSEVRFRLKITAPDDMNDNGKYLTKSVQVFDKIAPGFSLKEGSLKVISSTRGLLNIPIPLYSNTAWAIWELGEIVEGEEIEIEYVATSPLDMMPGHYEDQAYVLGVSITGGEVLGNVSTGKSDTEYVGTEIKILGLEAEEVGVEDTLPKTGASIYLTILGILTFLGGTFTLVNGIKGSKKRI